MKEAICQFPFSVKLSVENNVFQKSVHIVATCVFSILLLQQHREDNFYELKISEALLP